MVLSTRSSIADAYIVVLDVAADAQRALLFDFDARRVEGFAAQLPRRADADLDCLDEIHRLVHGAGFRVAAVVGRAEITAEDRQLWPAFVDAVWFPALPDGAPAMLGCGCVDHEQVALVMGEAGMAGRMIESPVSVEGLSCVPIDEKRWMLSGTVAEAWTAYSAFRQSINGSVERYLANAAADDPALEGLDAAIRRFRQIYVALARHGAAPQLIGCGEALMKAPSLAQRIADSLGVSLTLSTEAEPGGRGSALWALERIGMIENLHAMPASTGPVFAPVNLEATQ
jgi:hypothetical protein